MPSGIYVQLRELSCILTSWRSLCHWPLGTAGYVLAAQHVDPWGVLQLAKLRSIYVTRRFSFGCAVLSSISAGIRDGDNSVPSHSSCSGTWLSCCHGYGEGRGRWRGACCWQGSGRHSLWCNLEHWRRAGKEWRRSGRCWGWTCSLFPF